jgi:DNA-binding NarL/FixJ family response regulator
MKDRLDWDMKDYISNADDPERIPGRVFIVEDSFVVSLHLQKILSSAGHEIVGTASAGAEALEKIAKLKPGLVLLDVKLTDNVDGIQVGMIVKHQMNIPIAYVTVLDDRDTLTRMLASEPDGYLSKPFEDIDLLRLVDYVLKTIHK